MNRICLLLAFALTTIIAKSQNISSIQDGAWNVGSTWAGGVIPDANNSDVITIAHNVYIPSAYSRTIDGTIINSGASLTVRTGGTLNIVATPGSLTVNGDLTAQNTSSITNTNGTNVQFNTGSIYHHLFTTTQGIIPLATWDPNATLSIEGYTTFNSATAAGNWGQNFGNVLWNCSASNTTLNLNGLLVSILGNLTVNNTNTGTLQLTNVDNTNISIGGSLSILNKSKFNASTTATGVVIGIGGDLIYTSTATSATTIAFATTGSTTINLSGNFIMTGGTLGSLALSNGASGTGTLNIDGDFTINSGTFTLNSTSIGNVNFNGNGTQQYTMSGTIPTNRAFNYTVASTSILDMIGESYVGASGTGSFVVNGTVRLGSTAYGRGALVTGTLGGNVKMSAARTFNPGSTIVYAGTSAQIVGGGHPTTAGVNMIVDNPSGVTLDNTTSTGSALSNLIVGGDLTLNSGNLNIDTSPAASTRTLTINGNIIANGNNITVAGTHTDIVITGSGDLGSFPFPSGAQSFRNYSINRTSGSVDFDNDLALTGSVTCTTGDTRFNGSTTSIASTVTLNGGTIDFNGTGSLNQAFSMASGTVIYFEDQSLTLNGTLTSGGGLLSSNSNSSLSLTGSVAYGTLAFSPTGNTVGSLTINRTAGTQPRVSLNSTLNVTNSLTLTAGNLANLSGLTMGSGSTITRAGSAAITTTIPAGGPYDVNYINTSITTSLEAHGNVNNFTVNVNSANTVSGDSPITIAGQLHVLGGSFSMSSASTFTATSFVNDANFRGGTANLLISGDFTNNSTFNANTGTVTFNGTSNILGTTDATFYNLVISGTVNALTSNIGVLVNFTNNGTFNSGTGTVIFNGTTGVQNIQGSSVTTFNNINITNTSGAVRAQSSQNLAGILTLTGNPTTFDADGTSNTSIFTLLSTGDNPTADASIATLATGATVTGSVTVQRYMSIEGASSGRIYRYVSSPIAGATAADIQNEIPITGTFTGNSNSSCSGCSTGTQSMFGYDETVSGVFDNGYVNFPSATNTETFTAGRGYTIYVRGNILSSALWDLSGPVNQGSISLPVTFTASGGASNDGWNLVGNPYPSTIDWNSGSWTKAGLDGSVYIRDNGQTVPVYATYNGVTGTNNGSRYIATGQGFWVKATSAPTLTATEGIKVAGTSTTFIRQGSPSNLLRITMKNAVNRDEIVIHFRPDATTDFDRNADAWKLPNATFNLSSVLADGSKLAINSLPNLDCMTNVNLDVSNSAGAYKLQFSDFESFTNDVQLTLIDRFTNKTVDIRSSTVYEFAVTSDKASYGPLRFSVNVCGATQNLVTENEHEITTLIKAYPNPAETELNIEFPSTLNVDAVKMFSNFGIEVINRLPLSESNGVKKGKFDMNGLSSGLYIVRVLRAGKWSNIKVSKK